MSSIETRLKNLEVEVKLLKSSCIVAISEIPNHLRPTLSAVSKNGMVTASDVSVLTGRARALESSYLNVLVIMGLINKIGRKGKGRTWFSLKK